MTSFVDIYPTNQYIDSVYGDWEDSETLIITFSEGGRFSDPQFYEGVSVNYPSSIPSGSTITGFRCLMSCATGYTVVRVRCGLSLGGVFVAENAIQQSVFEGPEELTFDLTEQILAFILDNGGVEVLNDPDFGVVVFSAGNSDSSNVDYLSVSSVRIEIDFTPPAGFFSHLGFWLGGFGAETAPPAPGFRSMLGFWLGGLSGGDATPGDEGPIYRPVFRIRRR